MIGKSIRLVHRHGLPGLRTLPFGAPNRALTAFGALLLCVVSALAQTPVASFAGVHYTLSTNKPGGGYYVASSIGLDGAGNVFITDSSVATVAKLPPGGGTATPLATGVQTLGLTADQSGNVWVLNDTRMLKIDPSGNISYLNIDAGYLNVDWSGNVYFSGSGTPTYIIPAGTSTPALFSGAVGALGPRAVDQAGNVYLTFDGLNVSKVPPGCASSSCAAVVAPVRDLINGLALDRFGNLFISAEDSVYELPAGCTGCQVTLAAGVFPVAIAVNDRNEVYVATDTSELFALQLTSADFYNVNVGSSRTLTLNFKITSSVTLGLNPAVVTQGATGLDFTLSSTTCTGFQPAGNSCTVTVSFSPLAPGLRLGAVQLTDSSGNVLVTTPLHGVGVGPAMAFPWGAQTNVSLSPPIPYDVAVDAVGNVFFSDAGIGTVTKVPAGCTSSACQILLTSGLSLPAKLAVDGSGAVIIADQGNNRVLKVPAGCTNSSCQTAVGTGIALPTGVALDGAGDVLISDSGNNRIVKALDHCTGNGCQATLIDALDRPAGLALSTSGDLLVAQPNENQVLKYSTGCTLGACQTTIASGLVYPTGVAFNAAGDFYLTTFAGQVLTGPPGCGSTACQTPLGNGQNPFGISLSAAGDLFIAYAGSSKVSKISASQPSPLTFGSVPLSGRSNAQTMAVQNIGNVTLNWSGITASANFAVDTASTTCHSQLAPGVICTVGVVCTPTATGTLTGALTFIDNALNQSGATQAVPLYCTGAALPAPTVSFGGAPVAAAYQSTFPISATTNASTMPVVTASGGCTVSLVTGSPAASSATVTMTSGTTACSLTASWAADGSYAAATLTQSATASKIAPAATFTGAPAAASYLSMFPVASTTNASTAAMITASGACSIQGTTVSVTSASGTCTLNAAWAADNNYLPATLSQTTTAMKATLTAGFVGLPPTAIYNTTFQVVTSSPSTSTAVITASGACSNVGATVTMTSGTGVCTVQAVFAPDTNYGPATISQNVMPARATPKVTFTGAPATANYQSTFTVTASSNAGAPAVISAGGACSNSGATVTMTSGTGVCSLTATWAADNNYSAATATQSATANKIVPTVTFTGAPATANYQSTFTLTSTTNASTIPSTTYSGACSLSGRTVTMTSGTGTCNLSSLWAADNNYLSATANQSTTATKIAPAVTFTGAPANAAAGASFTVTASTNASTAATITAAGACSVAGTKVTMTSNTGTCQLTANWAADANYLAASAPQATLTAGALTNNLITLLNGFNSSSLNSFVSQLQALAKDIQNNTLSKACTDLATFIGSVNAQSGKKLTAAQAQQLLSIAGQVNSIIGCSL